MRHKFLHSSKYSPLWALLMLLLSAPFASTFAQQPVESPSPANVQELPVPQVAPNFRAQQKPLPDLTREGVDMTRQRPLSVRDALALALDNNKDIEVARKNVRIAEFDFEGARGAYDPRFTTNVYYERSGNPVSSFLSGGTNGVNTQNDVTGTVRYEGLSPKAGGNYRIDLSTVRLNTNNQFTALTTQFPTALTFTYTQPLLRGLKFDNSRRQIEIAKKNLSLTDAQFRQRAIETITNVQRAYWDLVFALRNLQIQRDAVRDARSQLEHNRRMVDEGQLAPIDIVAAEAQISTFEQSLFTALEDVSRTENNLKNLIAEDRNAPIWTESLVPTDNVELTLPNVTLPDALKTAMANRPELQQSNVAREINEIDRRYYKDQKKPSLNLVGSYGLVGLSGSLGNGTNPFTAQSAQLREAVNRLLTNAGFDSLPEPPVQTISPNLVGGFTQSFKNLFTNRFNSYRFGVELTLPLHNRTAEAQYGRSLVEGERIATQREQLEQNIQVEVRNALQSMRSAEARLRAAAATREASEEQYSSEQRKLTAGQSTVFLVLERQTALTTARGNELRAQTDLNKAIADLQRATGNALSVNSIVVSVH